MPGLLSLLTRGAATRRGNLRILGPSSIGNDCNGEWGGETIAFSAITCFSLTLPKHDCRGELFPNVVTQTYMFKQCSRRSMGFWADTQKFLQGGVRPEVIAGGGFATLEPASFPGARDASMNIRWV